MYSNEKYAMWGSQSSGFTDLAVYLSPEPTDMTIMAGVVVVDLGLSAGAGQIEDTRGKFRLIAFQTRMIMVLTKRQ